MRNQLVRRLINPIDVGAFFSVNLDTDEIPIHDRGGGIIFEGFMRHHMTPVAGGITDRKQDRFILFARQIKRLLRPWHPVHRVVGVLAQIRAGFLG